MAAFNTCHGFFKVLHIESSTRLTSGESPPCTMRSRVIRDIIPEAGNDVAPSTHRARNDTPLPGFHLNRPFACKPYILVEVTFALREIVVTVNSLQLDFFLMTILFVK